MRCNFQIDDDDDDDMDEEEQEEEEEEDEVEVELEDEIGQRVGEDQIQRSTFGNVERSAKKQTFFTQINIVKNSRIGGSKHNIF